MLLSRRLLMKRAAAAPLALKIAQDSAVASLTATRVDGLGGGATFFGGVINSSEPGVRASVGGAWKAKLLEFLGTDLFPSWFEDELRTRHRYVHNLDPDIANKRSWSMSVKICTQRERNVQRGKEEFKRNIRSNMRRDEFRETTGLYLPW